MLEKTGAGLVLRVKAHPGARRQGISGAHNGALKVEVTAAPEKGKANKAIIKVLAAALDLPRSNLAIIAGETSGNKKVLISNAEQSAINDKLAQLTGGEQ